MTVRCVAILSCDLWCDLGLGGSDNNCQNGSNSTQAKTGFVDGLSSSEPAVIADPGDAAWSLVRL